MKNQEECGSKWSWPVLRYHLGLCGERQVTKRCSPAGIWKENLLNASQWCFCCANPFSLGWQLFEFLWVKRVFFISRFWNDYIMMVINFEVRMFLLLSNFSHAYAAPCIGWWKAAHVGAIVFLTCFSRLIGNIGLHSHKLYVTCVYALPLLKIFEPRDGFLLSY